MRYAAIGLCAAIGLGAALVIGTPAAADYSVNGNDTGGVIPWSPAVDDHIQQAADDHCMRYNKIAIVTSVKRRYGDYIAFRCLFARDDDPMRDATFRAPPLMYQLGIVRYPARTAPR